MFINQILMLAQTDADETVEALENIVEATDLSSLVAGQSLVFGLTVFVLAVFLGIELISKIPPTLHTPLMSGSNAISGITLVGALLATGSGNTDLATFLGLLAVIMATINVVGGFLVTHRLLQKFRKSK